MECFILVPCNWRKQRKPKSFVRLEEPINLELVAEALFTF